MGRLSAVLPAGLGIPHIASEHSGETGQALATLLGDDAALCVARICAQVPHTARNRLAVGVVVASHCAAQPERRISRSTGIVPRPSLREPIDA